MINKTLWGKVIGLTLVLGMALSLTFALLKKSSSANPSAISSPSPTVKSTATLPVVTVTPTVVATATVSPSISPSTDYQAQAEADYKADNYSEAIVAFQMAIHQASTPAAQAILWDELGNAYRDSHSTDQAIAAYQEATTLDPTLITGYTNLSALYVTQGQRDKAQAVLQAGLSANPNNTQLQNALSLINTQGPSVSR